MQSMGVDDIVKVVRYKIDEIGENDSQMIGTDKDDSELTDIIKAVIPDAYRLVMLGADKSLLEGTAYKDATLTIGDDLIGKVKLPDNFLRLVSVRLSSWYSAAADIIQEDSAEYRQQSDQYASATYACPVAAIAFDEDGGRSVELYRAKGTTDTLRHFIYVPRVDSDETEYNIPDQLGEALTWYVAALTLTAVRDNHASACLEIAKGLMGGSDNG